MTTTDDERCESSCTWKRPKVGESYPETTLVVQCMRERGHDGDHHGKTRGGTGIAWS